MHYQFALIFFFGFFLSKSQAQQIFSGSITSEFSGLSMGNIYKLSNGELWEQTEAWTWAWTWSFPQVRIYKEGKLARMKVQNIDHPVSIRKVENFLESTITSKFSGLSNGNYYTLANGQTWKQTEYWNWIWNWYNPSVILWESGSGIIKMKVQGIDHPVTVEPVN